MTELISEFKPEELKTDLINQIAIQVRKDSDENIFKVSAELVQKDGIPLKYVFYFKNEVLNFARMTEFNEIAKDTVMDSEYYFDGTELLKQINRKKEEMDAETVRQASEFYLIYGKEAPIKNGVEHGI